MVEYIAYINCYLQFPNSESPILSLKRCIRSVFFYGVFFYTVFLPGKAICIFGICSLESICLGCGTARIESAEKQ